MLHGLVLLRRKFEKLPKSDRLATPSNDLGAITTPGSDANYLHPELRDMKIIGVEEHVFFPELTSRIPDEGQRVVSQLVSRDVMAYTKGRANNTGEQRLHDMNESGVAMQILSLAGPVNCMQMEAGPGCALAQDINNALKKAVDAHPDRFKALGELPFHAPKLALTELRRCINELGFVGIMMAGSVGCTGKVVDDPEFDELLSEFEALDVPLYLHPGIALLRSLMPITRFLAILY